MRRFVVGLVVALVWVGSGAAGAQPTLGEVVDAVERQGYYVEPGADADPARLAEVLSGRDDLAVVVLAADDPDGAATASEQVQREIGSGITVLVISPGEVAASPADAVTTAAADDGLDAALDAFDAGGSTSDAVAAFAGVLAGARVAGDDGTGGGDDGGGGATGFVVFLVILVVIVGGAVWFLRRRARRVDRDEIDRARAEIRSQLEAIAHHIVEREDEIDLAGHEEAIDLFRAANATYAAASERVAETENLLELAELNNDVDRARWQLEAADALIEGRPLPPEPEPEKPVACFFDPTHEPGTEEATIRTSAGNKEVRVCGRCARELERGERPEPRMIEVGGRRVPAAKAPRSHGGLGMGGLSIFEVILGGLGALAASRGSAGSRSPRRGVDLDWGDMLPRRRPSAGTFGPDRQPSRPRGLPRTPMSRPPRRSGGATRSRSRSPSRSRSRSRSRGR